MSQDGASEYQQLYTVKECAKRLRVDETTFRRWIQAGLVEAITLPHRGKRKSYRVTHETMDKLLTNFVQTTGITPG